MANANFPPFKVGVAFKDGEQTSSANKARQFATGATRNSDTGKLDYEGFLSPLSIERYARYMDKHRHLADGSLRDSDNWQAGIPLDAYMKSGWRHFFDWWKEHRGISTNEGLEDALCALIFNASGYLHEILKGKGAGAIEAGPEKEPALDSGAAAKLEFDNVVNEAIAEIGRRESV